MTRLLSLKQALTGALLLVSLLLAGCAGQTIKRPSGAISARPFHASNLGKSEIDQLVELTQREVLSSLERLAVKLYKRNPGEYRKSGASDPELAGKRLFDDLSNWPRAAPARADWRIGFRAAFDEAYTDDRVAAYMAGLLSMVMAAYQDHTEFFITDSLDAQRLYNSARNIEVAAWKLANAKFANGQKVLISNTLDGDLQNLSFEREFGKLIAQQDLLALVMEERTQRTLTRVLQNVATFVFIPL